ncbi:MAG TPA: tRNA dihydrouridine synthase DusB [Patescibacteria group bacterium]|jgi:nifR3 family TIM-barrel protein|nr:tRNA dihydrouridine synthase DusB [Patescibacteria group bacterium]
MKTSPLCYGPVPVDPPLVLAPMAGITDRHYRKIIKRIGGAGLVSMEFISSEGITRGNERTMNMMAFANEERPLAIQIYGSKPDKMAAAAEVVQEIGADVCDINMGCPANKILKGCSGAALMGDLALAERIIASARRVLTIPLTVKFRAGLSEDRLNYLELGRICEANGVQAVALHPRTAKQFYTGQADWDRIARLKEALSIPVVGNGDVTTPSQAVEMMRRTGCDAVMIGRGSMLNPWIFRQTAALLAGRTPFLPTLNDRRDLIRFHFSLLRAEEDDKAALHKMRKFTGWYTHGLRNGKVLRQKIQTLVSVDAFFEEFEGFFEDLARAEQTPVAV